MPVGAPLSTPLSQALVAFTIELDNEFERRFDEAGIGRRFGISLVMWSNFLRFVGDGITVGDLPVVAGLRKSRLLSTLGGMERWRYVSVGPETEEKRDGYGSARGLRNDWVVRRTAAGRVAEEIWRPLFGEMEQRWDERFGRDAVDDLRGSLRAFVDRLDVELPEYVPIVGGADGMRAGVEPRERKDDAGGGLSVLLSRTLLTYTLDFERESELSLPLTENIVRVLDERGLAVQDLPLAAGVSKEAVSMALTFLSKTDHVAVEAKVARLTETGLEAQQRSRGLHHEIERGWDDRFGADAVRRLRSSLEHLLDARELVEGLRPHPGGWRTTKRYAEHTEAMLADPRAALPRYPMVLHRGGWPDGS